MSGLLCFIPGGVSRDILYYISTYDVHRGAHRTTG
jgi:hypothetical protein